MFSHWTPELPKISENGQENLQHCYARRCSSIRKFTQYAVLASEKSKATDYMTGSSWLVSVANSFHDQTELMLKLLFDSRVIPYEQQYFMSEGETHIENAL